jgi:hypothetical protein
MFPSTGSAGRRFAFLHRVLRGEFPCFNSTIKALRLPAVRPAALRCLRLAVPRCFTRCVRSSADECAAKAWSWSPGISSRDFTEETTGPPKFLGNPNCPFAHVPIRRRQDCLHQTVHSAAAWPLVLQKQRLPRKVFRRSIAWLSDSLSTLRRTGYPATTQDSLPAAGQALPDGISTRKVPMKGFKFASLHFIPLSQALLGAM